MIKKLWWFVVLLACAATPSFFATYLPSSGIAGAESTGASCFHIANGSGGFAPGSGLSVTSIEATSAVLEITYVKSLACPLPGYIRYYWGPTYYDDKKADDSILTTAYEGFPVYSTGGDYVTKKITMTDIGTNSGRSIGYEVRPDTFIHVVVKLGYAGSTYLVRIGFQTPTDPPKNVNLRLDGVTKDSISVTPKLTASRFGVNTVGIQIKKSQSSHWAGTFATQHCDAQQCDSLRPVKLTNESETGGRTIGQDVRLEPNTTYNLRLSIHNYYSGGTVSEPLTVTTTK
jgi:hypothetical protein